jgi:ABC-2 type transport system permease protein
MAAALIFALGVLIGPLYSFVNEDIRSLTADLPDALLALIGDADLSTPEGWYQGETFSLMAPAAVILVTVVIGASALAGEEAHRTMALLLANPVSRTRIVLEKAVAMAFAALVVGVATFAGAALGVLLGGLDMSIGNVGATSLLLVLLGLVFGALALVLSAATGRVKFAVSGAIGATLGFYLLDSFLPLSDGLAGYARLSPFYYYLGGDPLSKGMHWGHGALLAGLSVALVALSVVLFGRRDLRQT